MRITPLDIRKQEFRKGMRGLDAEEVYAFLSTVGDEYEAVLNDNKALRERVLELDDKVQEYRTMERTLRDTLITAERVTIDAKDNARREANLIIKEAQIEAEKALRDIKSEAMRLRQDVSRLRGQRESYLGRMKVIAESLLKFLGGVEDDFHREDDAYQDQLPDEAVTKRESAPASTLADPPADNGSLFDEAPAAGTRPEPRGRSAAGVPSDFREREPASVESNPAVPVPVVPPAEPPDSGQPRNEEDTQATLSDINSIIERMAEGQKEILGSGAVERSGPGFAGADSSSEPAQFEPIRSQPMASSNGDTHIDEPPRTLEATTDDPTPAHGVPYRTQGANSPKGNDNRLPVGRAWESVPETATAVETMPPPERKPDPKSGSEVTSEISLDQIRRDLERRMSTEKKGN